MLLDIASAAGMVKKEAGMGGLGQPVTRADLKGLLKRWKIKELGNDAMKSGWSLYSARKLKGAIYIFKMNTDAGLHTGTSDIYYANANYGLGLSYAHSEVRHYSLAAKYLKAAVKYNPNGSVGKNARNFTDNKLMPEQLDYLYSPDKPVSYEAINSMNARDLPISRTPEACRPTPGCLSASR